MHELMEINALVPSHITESTSPPVISPPPSIGAIALVLPPIPTPPLINFLKYRDMNSVVAELELYRTSSYRHLISNDSDFSGAVHSHIQKYPTVSEKRLLRWGSLDDRTGGGTSNSPGLGSGSRIGLGGTEGTTSSGTGSGSVSGPGTGMKKGRMSRMFGVT